MSKRSQHSHNQIKGDNSNQQVGNNNIVDRSVTHITEYHLPKESTMSNTFNFLEIFNESDIPEENEFIISNEPAKIFEKLEYNGAVGYREISMLYTDDFVKFDKVILDFPDSMSIIRKLVHLFLKTKKIAKNSDETLELLSKEVASLIKSDDRFNPEKYREEDLDSFVNGFIIYGIHKCKILKNPNEK
ncbi:MAG: hypothetical protein LBV67_06170 [Streptococcaceae bacterium]|jgi:hypothetical protein|nr:hypothetical protein [Streptococcaceae bacterium]